MDFTNACKRASKGIGAFDALDESQAENTLFGYGDGTTSHFDATLAALLKDDETYGAAFTEAMEKTDSQGNTVTERGNMYNPLYYLSSYYDGYQKSTVADYWRIRNRPERHFSHNRSKSGVGVEKLWRRCGFCDNLGGRPYDGREHWGLCDELY